ncbi:glutathione peroxidase [Malassezia pachydermatis]|uniref:Glutathione peroxidase n=1 Tax=Malassezia pachydermatis TaxID=77020 RepID=A0A0M8MXT1_9BASI|nr:glutathione peroxidase [Malassezia pachydermatis]KOS16494.1 glutathione peroxidase [Malassezia pachydermatis]
MVNFYDLKAEMPQGKTYDFQQLKGKVVLIVNTASKCGFTPQFEGLEKLFKQYESRGLVILGFPCNQFASQDPGNDSDIGSFCVKNYGVSFPIMAKSDVNGEHANETFKFLKHAKPGLLGTEAIKWNFTKFLVDKQGNVAHRYSPTTKPESIAQDIEKLL